jgi:hypothetical protein
LIQRIEQQHLPVALQQPHRHAAVVVDDAFLADPIQRGHGWWIPSRSRAAALASPAIFRFSGIPRSGLRAADRPIDAAPTTRRSSED